MSKGLQYAIYLISRNTHLPQTKLLEILKPYKKELEDLANVQMD
jgi:hypothetical protein